MANLYVYSADGNDADDGSTRALAKATLTGALAIATAADTIWLHPSHAESTAGAVTLITPTTQGLRILCAGDWATEPPTSLSTTASVAVGASGSALILRGYAYIYGVNFLGATTSSSSSSVRIGDGIVPNGLILDYCNVELRMSSTSADIAFGVASAAGTDDVYVGFNNSTVKLGGVGQSVTLRGGRIRIRGMTVNVAGSTPTSLFRLASGANSDSIVESSNLSTPAFTNLLDTAGLASASHIKFRNLKIPSGITVVTGTLSGIGGPIVDLDNCDSADTNYRKARHMWGGSVVNESTIVRTGGANDGTSALSWKMTTTDDVTYPQSTLCSPEIAVWNDDVGVSKTLTVEIVSDGITFDDNEIWIRAQYLGTSGFPLSTTISDCPANVLTAFAAQDSSSVAWTTTGLSSPSKQKLSVTFTPQEKGFIHVVVEMARVTSVVYVCPKVDVT